MTLEQSFLFIDNINAGYCGNAVLHNAVLSVNAGETFGLIGLNGAGKTTLMKIILGLKNDAETGTVTLAGHPAGTMEAKAMTAFLPERFDPPWFLDAYEFLNFTQSLYREKSSRDDIHAMADRLGLAKEALARRVQSYSKGMRQKLGLMSVFLAPCPFLMLDEPMSGLDPLARAQVKSLMHQARLSGKTVFLSSHILADMEEICDRVGVLHKGRVLWTGTPAALLSHTSHNYMEESFLSLIGADGYGEVA